MSNTPIFDQACRLCEWHSRLDEQYGQLLRKASLFHFEFDPNEEMRKHKAELASQDFSMFALPFPVTAVEDRRSCVVLFDISTRSQGMDPGSIKLSDMLPAKGEKRDFGTDSVRGFAVFMPAVTGDGFMDKDADADILADFRRMYGVTTDRRDLRGCATYILSGVFRMAEGDGDGPGPDYKVGVVPFGMQMYAKDLVIVDRPLTEEQMMDDNDRWAPTRQDFITHPTTAVEELCLLNSGDRWLVKSQATTGSKPKKGAIRRGWQRPNYTLLTRKQIRETFKIDASSEAGRQLTHGHARRAHWKTLRHERYRRNHDGTPRQVFVAHTWVGPSSATVENKRYEVVLDAPQTVQQSLVPA